MSKFAALRRHVAAALLVALVALAFPHPAGAQPILRGKMQQAAPAAALWQPVRAAFAAPGQGLVPASLTGLAASRLTPPVVVVEVAPATPSAPTLTELLPLPAAPWLTMFLP